MDTNGKRWDGKGRVLRVLRYGMEFSLKSGREIGLLGAGSSVFWGNKHSGEIWDWDTCFVMVFGIGIGIDR